MEQEKIFPEEREESQYRSEKAKGEKTEKSHLFHLSKKIYNNYFEQEEVGDKKLR